mgnify:CR=1 FL=1
MKDFCMWIEQAQRKRKCHRCGGEIGKDLMFVRVGEKEKPSRATCVCALCFEKVMDDLSQNFQEIKERMQFPEHDETGDLGSGPHCFACGLSPEKCRCGWESYR